MYAYIFIGIVVVVVVNNNNIININNQHDVGFFILAIIKMCTRLN